MKTNPFEDQNAEYQVLKNRVGQYSLWPVIAPLPAGWQIVHDSDSRAKCMKYIEDTWVDMRPREPS